MDFQTIGRHKVGLSTRAKRAQSHRADSLGAVDWSEFHRHGDRVHRMTRLTLGMIFALALAGCTGATSPDADEVAALRQEVAALRASTPTSAPSTPTQEPLPTVTVAATSTQTPQATRTAAATPLNIPPSPATSLPKIADQVVNVVQSCTIVTTEPGKPTSSEPHIGVPCDHPLRTCHPSVPAQTCAFGKNPIPVAGVGGVPSSVLWYIVSPRTTLTVRGDGGVVYEVVLDPPRLVNVGDRWPPN